MRGIGLPRAVVEAGQGRPDALGHHSVVAHALVLVELALSLAAGSGCTFSVNVTATGSVLNLLTNPSVSVSSDQAPPSTSAASGIFVGNPFQLNYFRNLDISDSAINIINTGVTVVW